jgi:hypothetical protein
MREEAQFSDITWRANRLSFRLNSNLDHENGVTIMIPYRHKEQIIEEIIVNKRAAEYIVRALTGTPYAFLTVKPGAAHSISVIYSNL